MLLPMCLLHRENAGSMEACSFFITGPGFKSAISAGMSEIKAPTNMVYMLGRTQQTNSKQDAFSITMLPYLLIYDNGIRVIMMQIKH